MVTIVFLNNKGGVAKTESTKQLGLNLADLSCKVLLVDTDPQSSLTRRMAGKAAIRCDVADVLERKATWENAALRLSDKLYLLPATPRLENTKREMTINPVGVMALRTALASVKRDYDLCLVDTPPDMGALTMAAIVAADYLIVPLQAEADAIAGVDRVRETVDNLAAGLAAFNWQRPPFLGSIAVMVENNLQHQKNLDIIRQLDGIRLLGIVPARRGSSRGRNREQALRDAYLPIAHLLIGEVIE